MRTTKKKLLILGLCFSAGNALAGATFFESENFGGRQLVTNGTVPNFVDRGFNDRAASVIVDGAPVEVCADINFQGGCTVLNPGRYPTLGGLRNSISSVRELSGRNDRGYSNNDRANNDRNFGRDNRRGGAAVTFFDEENFAGRQLVLEGSETSFVDRNYNDRAVSAIVEGAPVEVCMDINFQGGCTVLNPGRYPTLGEMRYKISSVRMNSGRNDRGYSSNDRPASRDSRRGAAVTFFENENFSGRQLEVEGAAPNFVDRGFNDRAMSAIVEGAPVEVCVDINFQGGCTVLNPGRYPTLGQLGHAISSVRAASDQSDRRGRR